MNRLAAILPPAHVLVDVDVTSKKRVFEHAGLLFENLQSIPRATVSDNLFARERLGSTGLGHGVAIPHGRIKGLKNPMAAVLRAREPIAAMTVSSSMASVLASRASSTGQRPRAGTTMWLAKPPWMSLPGIFCARQIGASPRRHRSQLSQGSTAGTITARPSQASAPSPTATTRPLISCPSASGNAALVRTPS